jgi:hypothetical protein
MGELSVSGFLLPRKCPIFATAIGLSLSVPGESCFARDDNVVDEMTNVEGYQSVRVPSSLRAMGR